ncbi:MAG: GGDEF domain-containing protein [Lachnospiraceae bacterium]|nr:GGDEF domain-containing protein [Lachnospiraceae bacterium]
MTNINSVSTNMYKFNDCWTYDDGSKVDFKNLKQEESFNVKTTIDSKYNESCLCFHSKAVELSVYVNDKLCYDFHPKFSKFFGKSYGYYIHYINVDDIDEESELKMVLEPVYSDGTEFIRDIYFANPAQYMKNMVNKNILSFNICLITILFGFCILIVGIVFYIDNKNRLQPIFLGLQAMVSAGWCIVETLIIQMFTGNSPVCHFINYFTLAVFPIPAIYLVAYLTNNAKSKAPIIVSIISLLNLVIQMIITLTTDIDYHSMLKITHSIIIGTFIFVVVMIVKAFKYRTISSKNIGIVIAAFTVLSVSGLADILGYYVNPAGDYGIVFRFGIFLFVMLLGLYEIKSLISINEENSHANEMKKMAHEDGLTLLENRLAFNEYEKNLVHSEDGHYIIVMFDVNNLKKVNDQYGHLEGDRHIVGAAKMIKTCFGEFGRIFRTGGDEFVAILDGKNLETRFERAELNFEHMIDEYNAEEHPPIKMAIAYGAADYICGQNSLGNAEELADKLMYEHKLQLKSKVD